MPPLVKICGLGGEPDLDAALSAGADMVGFVFFPRSPRHLSLARARALSERCGARANRVVLTVDADDDALAALMDAVRPDILQLHGSETPERAAAVRRRFGVRVMRALSIGTAADLAAVPAFDAVCDLLLFDARAPEGADRPGGNGATFDWSLLRDVRPRCPWLLAGGLHAGNVAAALRETSAAGVDVSSGVEDAPGRKNPRRIVDFVAAVRSGVPVDAAPIAL